jgi:acyl carrier protein
MTTPVSRDDVRAHLVGQVIDLMAHQGGAAVDAAAISDDTDLLLDGYIDSLGLLELTESLNEFSGVEIDFNELDPELVTVVGPLTDFVASKTAALDV